jgi:hypothetical protein
MQVIECAKLRENVSLNIRITNVYVQWKAHWRPDLYICTLCRNSLASGVKKRCHEGVAVGSFEMEDAMHMSSEEMAFWKETKEEQHGNSVSLAVFILRKISRWVEKSNSDSVWMKRKFLGQGLRHWMSRTGTYQSFYDDRSLCKKVKSWRWLQVGFIDWVALWLKLYVQVSIGKGVGLAMEWLI